MRVLYVRNLVVLTPEKILEDLFNAASDNGVEKVKVLKDYAFVHLASRSQAQQAMDSLQGRTSSISEENDQMNEVLIIRSGAEWCQDANYVGETSCEKEQTLYRTKQSGRILHDSEPVDESSGTLPSGSSTLVATRPFHSSCRHSTASERSSRVSAISSLSAPVSCFIMITSALSQFVFLSNMVIGSLGVYLLTTLCRTAITTNYPQICFTLIPHRN